MIIQSATYSIIYSKANDIRRKVFNLEDKLEGIFATPFALNPIPDDAPQEIPRIQATSKLGHSNLGISLNNTQFSVNFDENFNRNIDKCLKYIEERILKIYDALDDEVLKDCLFTGLTLNILFDQLNNEDPIELISNNLFNVKSNLKPFDINSKVTYAILDKYYVNISCSNVRNYSGSFVTNETPLCELNLDSHMIGINLDINDRYAFNFKERYRSNKDEINKIVKISESILKNKLEKYIKEGVLQFDGECLSQ